MTDIPDRSPLIPSLKVPDVETAVAFYAGILGFEPTGRWEAAGELVWAEMTRGKARLWFFRDAQDPLDKPALTGFLYIFVDDVDAEAARLKDKVKTVWGPEDMEYGLREFGFEDLNGYRLVFAKDI